MNDAIRFVLDGEIIELRDFDPTMTVLQFLRQRLYRTGTKEGCAEGDCGACTVAVGELIDEDIQFRAINACIAFLPSLDGKEVVTIESLAKDGELHPAQKALIECHGSQCGFCTPGIAMSLFVHFERGGPVDDQALCDALAGNLCRCTGYGPILAAGSNMAVASTSHWRRQRKDAVERIQSLQGDGDLELEFLCGVTGARKRYFAPRHLDSLLKLKARFSDAVVVSGATDVGLWVTKQNRVLETVIAIGDVGELNDIAVREDGIVIGAGVTYSDALDVLHKWNADAGEIIRRTGAMQIRNRGTIGGNVANGSPIGDSMPWLIAGGAQVCLRSAGGSRELPLEDFYIDYNEKDLRPDEIVEHIFLPKLSKSAYFRAYKISKRFDQDISALCGAFNLEIAGQKVQKARIAFGGMAATPKRARECEDALAGKPWTEKTLEEAVDALANDFSPISDMRASAHYRLKTAQNLLRKMFLESKDTAPSRVLDYRATAHG